MNKKEIMPGVVTVISFRKHAWNRGLAFRIVSVTKDSFPQLTFYENVFHFKSEPVSNFDSFLILEDTHIKKTQALLYHLNSGTTCLCDIEMLTTNHFLTQPQFLELLSHKQK